MKVFFFSSTTRNKRQTSKTFLCVVSLKCKWKEKKNALLGFEKIFIWNFVLMDADICSRWNLSKNWTRFCQKSRKAKKLFFWTTLYSCMNYLKRKAFGMRIYFDEKFSWILFSAMFVFSFFSFVLLLFSLSLFSLLLSFQVSIHLFDSFLS